MFNLINLGLHFKDNHSCEISETTLDINYEELGILSFLITEYVPWEIL